MACRVIYRKEWRIPVKFGLTCSRQWTLIATSPLPGSQGDDTMWSRWICVAAFCLGTAPQAVAAEPLIHRASCTVVRFYVAKYSAFAAESWARSHGATDAEIEAARHCLKDAPAETTQAARWAGQ